MVELHKFDSDPETPGKTTTTPTIIKLNELLQTPTRVQPHKTIIDLTNLLSRPEPAALAPSTSLGFYSGNELDPEALPPYPHDPTTDPLAPAYTCSDRLRGHKIMFKDPVVGQRKSGKTWILIGIVVLLVAMGVLGFLTFGFMKLGPKFEGKAVKMKQEIQEWNDAKIRHGY